MYENHYPGWIPTRTPDGKLYVDITDVLDVKLRALKKYASQLRPYPHLLSVGAIELIASMHGLEIGCQYAELFYVAQIIGLPRRQ